MLFCHFMCQIAHEFVHLARISQLIFVNVQILALLHFIAICCMILSSEAANGVPDRCGAAYTEQKHNNM